MKSIRRILTALLLSTGLLLPMTAGAVEKPALPRLVDLGADKCIPCRMMAPILDELKATYTDKLEVEFIDVWKHREEAERYGVRMIPTQIFYSPDGKELYRHQGFFAKEDILAKWRNLGYDFKK
ncbi:MAG: thioredoxin family protein [Desulfuromonadales bacterium]|jgi:thioredoxin 1